MSGCFQRRSVCHLVEIRPICKGCHARQPGVTQTGLFEMTNGVYFEYAQGTPLK